MKLFENIGLGRPQIVDSMTVVPLVGHDQEGLAPMADLEFTGNQHYGEMEFENRNPDRPNIAPSGYSVMEPTQSAQDHASISTAIVPAGCKLKISDACCIEQTQGGSLRGRTQDFNILPLGLRKESFSMRGQKSYNKLWDAIRHWQGGLVGDSRAHLVFFFTQFKDRLAEFCAEFEPVPGQRGAVVLFEDRIVGIELVPTHSDWIHFWRPAIRGCYGSEYIKQGLGGRTLKLSVSGSDLRAISSQIKAYGDTFISGIQATLSGGDVKALKSKNPVQGVQNHEIKFSGARGDLVSLEDQTLYLSAVF